MAATDRRDVPQARRGRIPLLLSALAFALFTANAIVGKASLLLGAATPVHMGNVPEFCLLVFATACFVVAILAKEDAREAQSGKPFHQEEGTP